MANKIGESKINQSSFIIPRTELKIFLQVTKASFVTTHEMQDTWVVDYGPVQLCGHFVAYHQKFFHEENKDWLCSCEKNHSVLHLFQCINVKAHKALL